MENEREDIKEKDIDLLINTIAFCVGILLGSTIAIFILI